MPLHLGIQIANPELSAHEALRVSCRLQNDESEPRTIPGPYDRSGAFQLSLFDADASVRVMDRQTRQFMMSEGRVDASLDLDTLPPGEGWNWQMDLASYHYAIPPGSYSLRASYLYQEEKIYLQSSREAIRVTSAPLLSVQPIRDNPILDGLNLLMGAQGRDGVEYYLRQHNYARPFGAWWSARVLAGEDATAPFVASSNFFQTRSSEPFHRKWVIWTNPEGMLCARCYDRGLPSGGTKQSALPKGLQLIRSAIATADDDLLVFFRHLRSVLCYRLEERVMTLVFEHELAGTPDTEVAIGGREATLYIATASRGVAWDQLNYEGKLLNRQTAFATRMKPVSLVIEASEQRIKALFADSYRGKSVEMAVVDLSNGLASRSVIGQLPLRSEWRELSFDQDRSGRFHLAISTQNGRLYYYSDGRGPQLIAEGELPFFPIVVAPLQVYVGLYREQVGYRFVQYQRRRRGSKIVGLPAHP